jgi:hypothetical protein
MPYLPGLCFLSFLPPYLKETNKQKQKKKKKKEGALPRSSGLSKKSV